MKNKTGISTTFGLTVIGILAVSLLVLSNSNNTDMLDQKHNQNVLGFSIQRKNAKIRLLTAQLAEKQKELDTAKQDLLTVKNDLNAVNNKLAVMIAAPVAETTNH